MPTKKAAKKAAPKKTVRPAPKAAPAKVVRMPKTEQVSKVVAKVEFGDETMGLLRELISVLRVPATINVTMLEQEKATPAKREPKAVTQDDIAKNNAAATKKSVEEKSKTEELKGHTLDDVKAAAKTVIDGGNREIVASTLLTYRAGKLSELDAEHYTAFINDLSNADKASSDTNGKTLTIEDVTAVAKSVTREKLIATLSKHEAGKLSFLKPKDYQAFINDLNAGDDKTDDETVTSTMIRELMSEKADAGKAVDIAKLLGKFKAKNAAALALVDYAEFYNLLKKL